VGTPNSFAHDLVFAIAHEVGNHLGAIRIQAHLLDEDLDPRSLAQSSVEIDGLAGRVGPMLALLRPLLSSDTPAASGVPWSGILATIKQHLEDEGTRGVSVEIEAPRESDPLAPSVDWL
jgi:nitrogen-specific signal transduction histidine kinase